MPEEMNPKTSLRDLILEELSGDTGVVTPVEITRGMWQRIPFDNSFLTRLHDFTGKSCSKVHMLDIGGNSTTGGNGVAEIHLEDFVCLSQGDFISTPVVFVATPRSRVPVQVTFHVDVKDDDLGIPRVHIQVFSWSSSGDPAPGIGFAWRCYAQLTIGNDID